MFGRCLMTRLAVGGVLLICVTHSDCQNGSLRAGEPEVAKDVDYLQQIKPLLAQHCVACHGPEEQQSGLRLDTAAGAVAGGHSGPSLVPGKSSESLFVQALKGTGDVTPMPAESDPLPAAEIALVERWIDAGAPFPADEAPPIAAAKKSNHWSFQPIVRHDPPQLDQDNWSRNPIDNFIKARLSREAISPSAEADRTTLIRRLSLDLVGLPPTPAEVDDFLADQSEGAYERLVDRLLASPHYGERWGRIWLDAARYADSNGYTIDGPRTIWKYRDWVIDALNRDLPFDRFVTEQLAGDLLPDATNEQLIATGFHRNTLINEEGGTDPEQFRVEAVVDRVSTTGEVLLGLTMGCARCHDHKYDPISQRDFYQLFAFFNTCDEPVLELPTPEEVAVRAELEPQIAELDGLIKARDEVLATEQVNWEARLSAEEREKLSPEARSALSIAVADRNEAQVVTARTAHHSSDAQRVELIRKRDDLKKKLPQPLSTLIVRERKEPRITHIMLRGDFLRHGAQVAANVPGVLPPLETKEKPTRLDFARWLFAPANPLTARVAVNRLWQAHFGRGLVETDNDFGTQGSLPTHPELLDWLASEFLARGWSFKAMHRLIVTSATYRQASRSRADLAEVDPDNRLLARQSRMRLEAEAIRDNALAVSGLLSAKIGGPSVYPPQPDGVMQLAQVKRDWMVSAGEDRYRRGMYTYFWRSSPYPFLRLFDGPDANTACTRRNRSNTPLQALTLLNDEAFVECANSLATKMLSFEASDDRVRLRQGFRACLAREPEELELDRLERLIAESSPTSAATSQATESGAPVGSTPERFAAWRSAARVLLNLDEFITRE